LLGAHIVEFALDISANRSVGSQGLQAPGELIVVYFQLAGVDLGDSVTAIVRGGRNASVLLAR
jgi:hypothetical protein